MKINIIIINMKKIKDINILGPILNIIFIYIVKGSKILLSQDKRLKRRKGKNIINKEKNVFIYQIILINFKCDSYFCKFISKLIFFSSLIYKKQ